MKLAELFKAYYMGSKSRARVYGEDTEEFLVDLVYSPDKGSTWVLNVENAISGFLTSYAKIASLKYSYSERVLAKIPAVLEE
ncbi:hypothetical protein QYM36_006662 [Artemia franciscana]|uniref:Uncharacterized protein n=1 Tax=Artemia franciscana TaxID=6661 RepID=A0AA88I4A2_ARTSF|nr:hypothetical protein QYM36_006662 [Artemia franciscana]